MAGGEYLLEFVSLGGAVKVTAVDPESGAEASIVGAATASQRQLADLAIRKLKFVLEKKSAAAKPPAGRGVVV